MHEAAPEELPAGLVGSVSEVAEETPGRDLHERPPIDELLQARRVAGKPTIPLRMGNDGCDIHQRQFVEHRFGRGGKGARKKFKKQIASPIQRRQGTCRPPFQQLDRVRGEGVLATRQDRWCSPEESIQFQNQLVPDRRILIEPSVAQNVRSGYDRSSPFGSSGAAEGDRFLPVCGAIVEARQAMEVGFDQGEYRSRLARCLNGARPRRRALDPVNLLARVPVLVTVAVRIARFLFDEIVDQGSEDPDVAPNQLVAHAGD